MADIEGKVSRVLDLARRVLDNSKRPLIAGDYAHKYADKYILAEVLVNTSVAAQLNVLEMLGLNAKSFRVLREWSREKNVTLRFKAEERCEFDREVKREEESATKNVRDYGIGTITDKVVTTITEYFWRFECSYELAAFAGNNSDDKVVLQARTGRYEIKTTGTKDAPKPKVAIRDALDCNVTWLLSQINDAGQMQFGIKRERPECRTPRRNPESESALEYFERFEQWCNSLNSYFLVTLFPVQKEHGLALSAINDSTIFVPVVPVFVEMRLGAIEEAAEHDAATSLASLTPVAVQSPVLSTSDLNRFLEEQRRTLSEKFADLAKAFPDQGGHLITASEANLCVAVQHGERVTHYLVAGLDYIEDLLRQQLVAAIGKELTPVDFGKYMVYHNKRVFRPEYQPRGFCYAVRRPGYYPEGTVSIEAHLDDGSMSQPVQTMVNESEMLSPMHFSIAASAKVTVSGRVYVHGLMMHQFEDESGMKLTLNARARQFSSFLVLVGRIAGPGLFDPQYGVIVQNKDEVTIPLDIETIPSAGEFKAATVSISPEQQAFAKMFRGMQLASTLFAVCVVQIKPQMERVLKLTNESLTKEIRLTQDLLELFIQYQIPSDLMSYGGSEGSGRDLRLAAVKRNVKAVQLTIEWEKLKELEQSMQEEENKAIDAASQQAVSSRLFLSARRREEEEEDEAPRFREGGRRGKVIEAKRVMQTPSPAPAPAPAPAAPAVEAAAAAAPPLPQPEMSGEEERRQVSTKADKMDMEKKKAAPRKKEMAKKEMKEKEVMSRRRSVARDKYIAEEEEDREEEEWIDPRIEEMNRIRREFAEKRARLEQRRSEIVEEKARLEAEQLQADESRSGPVILVQASSIPGPDPIDYTKIPAALDEALERLDTDGALRPSIINVGKTWSKRSQAGLLGAPTTTSLAVDAQKLEKNTCYDLLDALTRSGGLGINDVSLHIVVSTTHCFARNLMDTLVKDNRNPIENVEHTQLIVASHVFDKKPEQLLLESELSRVKAHSPNLF